MSGTEERTEDYSARPGTADMRERMLARAKEVGIYSVGDDAPERVSGRDYRVQDLAKVQLLQGQADTAAPAQAVQAPAKLKRLPEILDIEIEEPSRFVQLRYKGEIVTLPVPPVKLEDGQLLGWYQDQISSWTVKVRESKTEEEALANNKELFKFHMRQIRMMVPDITDDMMHAIHGKPYKALSEYISQAALEELGIITDDMYEDSDPKGEVSLAS